MAQEVQNGGSEHGNSKALAFSALKPMLLVEAPKAADAIQFYRAAFGAEEVSRVMHPKRKADQELPLILSAELKFGAAAVLVSDISDDAVAPFKSEGAGSVLCLETDDVDAAVAKAVAAGAVQVGVTAEGDGACCGGRAGKLKDPYGFVWIVCSPAKECTEGVEARVI